jgi:intron-binding protein aquarius
MLQKADPEAPPRLKRVVLIGDHYQLPPIVQNMAIARLGHLDQSLFARFARLGVPNILLDRQGRARPSLAALYNWRYKTLGDLPHVQVGEYTKANAGFLYEYQLVNVDDFQGRGESTPSPHFYQNLGEAEYVVATYMFMRMLGYPKEKIAILTTYNGQKHLIRDVIEARCAKNPSFGRPSKVATVDRYQGQQNDFILLSLVRTASVGHLRDVRRLIVAMSRARLGLYVFCRRRLFENCYELTPTFAKLLERPDKLVLVQEERYGAEERTVNSDHTPLLRKFEVQDVLHMAQIVTGSPSQ